MSKITKKPSYFVVRTQKQKQGLVVFEGEDRAYRNAQSKFPKTGRQFPDSEAAMPVRVGNCGSQLHEGTQQLALFFERQMLA